MFSVGFYVDMLYIFLSVIIVGAGNLTHLFGMGKLSWNLQVARMSGTGGQLYTALSNSRPSAKKMLEAFKLYCQYCPFIRASYYFANHTILDAFKDAPRVHVVDYGILYGTQWPCLIHQLSERKGGPPHLRITGYLLLPILFHALHITSCLAI